MNKLYFPQDELIHEAVVEWWYWNGNLKDKDKNDYAFMRCLFKIDPRRARLPFLEKIPLKEFYFSHHLLSDYAAKKFDSGINLFYEGPDKKSFSKDLLLIDIPGNFSVEETSPFAYKLKTAQLDLEMVSRKPPLLINEGGWIDVKSTGSYYYSLTNLETRGKINFGGKKLAVGGKSWMDHQWAHDPASSEDKWNWFSLQFDNGLEILCCEYGEKKRVRFASASNPDGSQRSSSNINFTSLGKAWKSPKTQAVYPMEWKIEIPDWDTEFFVESKMSEQEIIFGATNYWEGGVRVKGKMGGQEVSGEGFMELLGFPMGKSVARIYLEETKNLISNYLINYIVQI